MSNHKRGLNKPSVALTILNKYAHLKKYSPKATQLLQLHSGSSRTHLSFTKGTTALIENVLLIN